APLLPAELPAIADTLARIHALPLLPAGSPIPRQANPFLETLQGIEHNAARFLDQAVADAGARAAVGSMPCTLSRTPFAIRRASDRRAAAAARAAGPPGHAGAHPCAASAAGWLAHSPPCESVPRDAAGHRAQRRPLPRPGGGGRRGAGGVVLDALQRLEERI